jgi:hypothetical protein
MKLNRFFLSLVASLFTLFSCGQVAAQAPAAVTLIKAGRLLDPRTGGPDDLWILSSRTIDPQT